jgi:hypothetical protein
LKCREFETHFHEKGAVFSFRFFSLAAFKKTQQNGPAITLQWLNDRVLQEVRKDTLGAKNYGSFREGPSFM